MGLQYDKGMLYQEMGAQLHEYVYLEKAAGIFTKIGAEYDLVKVRQA